MHVNFDFSDPSQGNFASHCARPMRFIFDRNYFANWYAFCCFVFARTCYNKHCFRLRWTM